MTPKRWPLAWPRPLRQWAWELVVGVPKTIDNDLGDRELVLVDHTPGYGSVARYWAWTVQCLEEENRGSAPVDPVLVIQAMGRRVGFIPAAARLADPERQLPLLIFLPEAQLTLEEIAYRLAEMLRRLGPALVVVSEDLKGQHNRRTKRLFWARGFFRSNHSGAICS